MCIYSDEDLVQLSALQHFTFCPRQCALIHIEQVWSENVLTAEGRGMHEKAHEEQIESRDGLRIERGMSIRSLTLGLSGKIDVVEFHRQSDGSWMPFPIEYKHGKPKTGDSDTVQLCAQAICLEEMTQKSIPQGAIFYGKTRRRHSVEFDATLRSKTIEAARQLHDFLDAGKTPLPEYLKRCESCSLIDKCKPKKMEKHEPVGAYITRMLQKE